MSALNISHVDFVTVFVDDYDDAIEFYGTTLGLEHAVKYGEMRGGEFEAGNVTLSILESKAIGREFTPSTHPIALRVDDVEAARAELESKGVEFAADTLDSGVCHMAFFTDPGGNALMLHHRYAPRPD
jgi:predicted enzyme related to lactoylglutathione lyase